MFPEVDNYRETLEIKRLRVKNILVLIFIIIMMATTVSYMLITGQFNMKTEVIPFIVGYFIVIVLNFTCLAYGGDNYRFYLFNKYLTTIGIFIMSIALVFIFQSPSAITALFIAYAITAFYQDIKGILLSDAFLLFSIVMFMIKYPEFMNMTNTNLENIFGTVIFFVAFVLILTVSSYIIFKQKQFFYNQIALSKEAEYRNIDLLTDLQKTIEGKDVDIDDYYVGLNKFLEAFSQKLGIENAFKDKTAIMLEMEKGANRIQIREKHPELSDNELDSLESLLIGPGRQLRKVAVKMSRSMGLHIKKREIFSETHFKSFNHQSDDEEIRIMAFVVFYVALKRGFIGLPKVGDKEIYNAVVNTDYFYFIDPRVMSIYQKNSEIFATISDDHFGKKGSR